MLADFPGHPGPGDVYQYPISTLTCQAISNTRAGVFSEATMGLSEGPQISPLVITAPV